MRRPAMLRRLGDELSSTDPRTLVREVLEDYDRHDILTFASAIAFQVFFATIPLALVGLGLLGGLGLDDRWSHVWAPQVQQHVSAAMYVVISDTVQRVLGGQQFFWITLGAAITVWKVSGTARAIMDVFDRIYGSERERSFWERMRVSIVLGLAMTALLLLAAAIIGLGGAVLPGAVAWVRWPLAALVLCGVITLLVGFAPADRQPVQWVTFGALVVVVAWIATSLVLGWYMTSVANYGSIFGALASVVVTLTYVYFASAAFLTGAVIDARIRKRVEGDRSGRFNAAESRDGRASSSGPARPAAAHR